MIRAIVVVAVLLVGVLVGIILVGFSPIGMVVYQGKQSLDYEDLAMVPQLSIVGFARTMIDVDENRIFLYSGCRRLVMITNEYQTMSIKDGLEGELNLRPNSHDIIRNVLETFDMKPIMVKITHLEDNTYYARLFLMQGTRILNLDVRPSDSIAIAARTATPIYVNQTLMEEQGEKIC